MRDIKKYQRKILENIRWDFDAFLISNKDNIFYLTDCELYGCFILILKDGIFLFSNKIYKDFAKNKKVADEIIIYEDFAKDLKKFVEKKKIKKLGFEDSISYRNYNELKENLDFIKLIPVKDLIEDFRKIKEDEELRLIKKAISIAERTFSEIKEMIRSKAKIRDIAFEFLYKLRKNKAEKEAFDPILATGKTSSYPHAYLSSEAVKDHLIFDFGARYKGYNSDITRTIILKENKKLQKIYNIVLKAQKEAINLIKPGLEISSVDKKIREIFEKEKLLKYFLHSSGHGIGIAVHEKPTISYREKEKFSENMVVTIEPGIYIPNLGGVRIEDMILITKTGFRVLTSLKKEEEDFLWC